MQCTKMKKIDDDDDDIGSFFYCRPCRRTVPYCSMCIHTCTSSSFSKKKKKKKKKRYHRSYDMTCHIMTYHLLYLRVNTYKYINITAYISPSLKQFLLHKKYSYHIKKK